MKSIAMFVLVLLLVAGGSCSASAQEVKNRQDVLAELAAIELRVTVDRDFAGADSALTALEAQYANAGLGDVLTDPVVEATRVRIRSTLEAARQDDGQLLQQSVADAIRSGDQITLTTLGSRAATAIAGSLRSGEGPLAEVDLANRLDWMLRLNADVALDFFKDDPTRLGPDNLGLVFWAIAKNLSWTMREGRRPVLARPEWLDVLAAMLESPFALATFGDRKRHNDTLGSFLGTLTVYDAFTPRLQDVVIRLVSRMDGYATIGVLDQMGHVWTASSQPILEHFVTDERLAVRSLAARTLVSADASPGLRSRIHDPDVGMRLLVLQSLAPRRRTVSQWNERGDRPGSINQDVSAVEDAEGRELLATLAADPDPVVREKTVAVLAKLKTPLSPGVYRSLAADPDSLVRAAMADLDHPDPALRRELHVQLAHDVEPSVIRKIEYRLASGNWQTEVDWLLPLLVARLENAAVPLGEGYFLSNALAMSPAARRECTQLALRTQDATALRLLAQHAILQGSGDIQSMTPVREWLALPGNDLVRLLPLLHEVSAKLSVALAYAAADQPIDPVTPEALEPLARAAEQPLDVRLSALSLALHDPTPERLDLLKQLLSDPDFAPGSDRSLDDALIVAAAVSGVPADRRNAVIHEVLRLVPLRDELRLRVIQLYRAEEPDAEPVVRMILEEWLDRPEAHDLVVGALPYVCQIPALADEAMLRRALRSPLGYAEQTVTILGVLRDPRFLPLLQECLDPAWIPLRGEVSRAVVAGAAVGAMQGYMSDEAASMLLEAAASSPYASVREKALVAVEAIGRYRDALAAWQRRTAVATNRESTIGQLASIAADSSAGTELRAAALRGLGTLQAVEMMPLIIRALTDSDAAVRQAAEMALDRLNAPAPAGPPPAATEAEPRKP